MSRLLQGGSAPRSGVQTQSPQTPSGQNDAEIQFPVTVVFTTPPDTLTALRRAAELAEDLNAGIRIVVPHIVPYPLPLEKPPVNQAHYRDRLRTLVVRDKVPACIEVCLCRDTLDGVLHALAPHSLVVIGGRSRRWPTRTMRLMRRLRLDGHEVVLVEPNGGDHDFRHRLLSTGSVVLCRLLGLHEGL